MRRVVPAAAALLLLVVCAAAALHSTAPVTPGMPIPRGVVRWLDATAPSRGSREVTVTAQVGSVARFAGCARLVALPRAIETKAVVTVEVGVVERIVPRHGPCEAPTASTVVTSVRLAAPVGDRRLVDGSGAERRPLFIVRDAPRLSAPAGFVERLPGFEAATGWLSLRWRDAQDRRFDLDQGPVAALPGEPHRIAGVAARPVAIGGVEGRLWRRAADGEVRTLIVWPPTAGIVRVLDMADPSTTPLPAAEVVALARSVR